ncbi:hypothetical protein L9F63_024802, partial [Diploptera punctata]
VLEKVDRYWWYGCCDGKYGKFPSSHLILVDVPSLEDNHELFAAIADFSKQQDGDLGFSRGELIVGESQINEDWWYGRIDVRKGIFPVTYTWRLESKYLKAKLKPKPMNKRARVKMSMKAQLEEEMDLHEGDIVVLKEIIDKNWYRGVCGSREGIFPSTYVEILEGETGSNINTAQISYTSDTKSTSDIDTLLSLSPQAQYPPVVNNNVTTKSDVFDDDYFKVNMPSMYRTSVDENEKEAAVNTQPLVELDVVPYGITLYPFYAQFDNELSFHEGEIVTLCRHIDKDWIEGKIDGKKGIFPKSYVNILVDCDSYSNFSEPNQSEDLDAEVITDLFAKVLYNFDAQMTGDLTVHKDEVVWIVSKANEDWCEVKNQSGIVGLCPRNYLTPQLYPAEMKSKFARGTSLATDDLLGLFTSSEESLQNISNYDTGQHSSIRKASPEAGRQHNEVELRHIPEEKPHFQRQDLKRHSSDRLPHRPAPPVPVPGQKPVRRSLRRVPTRFLIKRIIEETTVIEDKAIGGRIPTIKPGHVNEEQGKKNEEQRQNVISELVYTEKEYVRDLKITYETFNLHNPAILEARGVDVKTVFGNILEVMHLAEELLDKLQLAMKGREEEDQCIGPCFIELADQMKCVYGQYCMNHNNALILLEKYESVQEIQTMFDKGIETLRYQIACFDMGSILIKPVQRILKYPLILNELIKFTEDSHKDKPELLKAVRTMMDVATYINEYKRRQDIVSKYLGDETTSISGKMSRLSLHSVAKKSSRLGVMLTSTLFGVATKDPVFDEHEFVFHSTEKTVRNFIKNVEAFLHGMQEQFASQLHIHHLSRFYEISVAFKLKIKRNLQSAKPKSSKSVLKKIVEKKVLAPLNVLVELFEGPAILIQKRHDKLLDYDGCCAKAEKNKENRLIQEELLATKSNYEALNNHLLEELPSLNKLACDLLVECLAAFISARKMLSGKITKEYLMLMELPIMKSCQGDAVETFPVKHSLVWNQLTRFNFDAKHGKTDTLTRKESKSPTLSQSPSQQAYLQSRYTRDMLFSTTQPYRAADVLEISIERGLIVGVIKKHDPSGDASRWFVDDGTTKGFIPSECLEPLYQNVNCPSPLSRMGSASREVTKQPPKPANTRQADVLPPPSRLENGSRQVTKQPPKPANTTHVDVLPPPSYADVISSQAGRYEEIEENETDGNFYSEIPAVVVRLVVPRRFTRECSTFYYATYDFEGQGMNMLSIKKCQVVLVLQQQDFQGNPEWWLVEDRFGNKGYVPANYLSKYQQ